MVDLMNHKGVIWEQELYDGFELIKHTPFFYSFAADEYMAGLSFADINDADVFFNKLNSRETHSHKKKKETSGKKPKGKLDKSQIGLPSEFRHLGHIGYTPSKGFSVQNSSPEWNGFFDQLKDLGLTTTEINDNQEFIQDFVSKRGGFSQQRPQPPPPPPRSSNQKTRPPPPPPPRKVASVGGRRPPPPPPPSRRTAPPPPPMRPSTRMAVPRSSIPAPPPPIPRKTTESDFSQKAIQETTITRPSLPPPPPPVRKQPEPPSQPNRSPSITKSNNPYKMLANDNDQPALSAIPAFPFPEATKEYEASPVNRPPPTRRAPPPVPSIRQTSTDSLDVSSISTPPVFTPTNDEYSAVSPEPTLSTAQDAIPPPPPPPPLPAQTSSIPVPPPAPLVQTSSIPTPPPLPVQAASIPAPPPPPPPAQAVSAPAPPPPPSSANVNQSPPPGDSRNALLESIRAAGGIQALRNTPTEAKRDRNIPAAATTTTTDAKGGDLATSLIAALNDRKKAILSDDDESDSDGSEWDD
ncbi:hypothetical protein RMCBS344292_17798 [Rhizopus microsporus]|nr:hypothetical protein RMCBS344292_17798 [Rhizopus microsporus]